MVEQPSQPITAARAAAPAAGLGARAGAVFRVLVPIAALAAVLAFSGQEQDPAAWAEGSYLGLLIAAVLATVAVLAPPPAAELGWGAVLAAAACWALPPGPPRGAATALLLLVVWAVGLGRRLAGEVPGWETEVGALALGRRLAGEGPGFATEAGPNAADHQLAGVEPGFPAGAGAETVTLGPRLAGEGPGMAADGGLRARVSGSGVRPDGLRGGACGGEALADGSATHALLGFWVPAAFGAQLLLRGELLFPPGMRGRSLAALVVLPLVGGAALAVLARRHGVGRALTAAAAALVLAPGWTVTSTLALAALAAGSWPAALTRPWNLRGTGGETFRFRPAVERSAAAAVLIAPLLWQPRAGWAASAAGLWLWRAALLPRWIPKGNRPPATGSREPEIVSSRSTHAGLRSTSETLHPTQGSSSPRQESSPPAQASMRSARESSSPAHESLRPAPRPSQPTQESMQTPLSHRETAEPPRSRVPATAGVVTLAVLLALLGGCAWFSRGAGMAPLSSLGWLALVVPGALLPARPRLALGALLLALITPWIPDRSALAAPLALAALALPAGGPAAAAQRVWSASLAGGTALLASYPWLRADPLAAALALLGAAPGPRLAAAVAVAVVALTAGGALAVRLTHRLRPEARSGGAGAARTPDARRAPAPTSPPAPPVPGAAIALAAAAGAVLFAALLLALPRPGAPVLTAVVALDGSRGSWETDLTAPARAASLAIDSSLTHAAGLANGTPVATVTLRRADGARLGWILRAGEATGEWAARRPDVAAGARLRSPPAWLSWVEAGFFAQRYRALWRLPAPGRFVHLRVERAPGLPADIGLALYQLELRP